MRFHSLDHFSAVTISATICAGIISCKDHKKTEDNTQTFPNIVYILADDLGYGDVKINNPESKIPTPNIDQLAREGIRFTDGHSPAQICAPSRYSILTSEDAPEWQLYDVESDPLEQKNLFDERQDVVKELEEMLNAYINSPSNSFFNN